MFFIHKDDSAASRPQRRSQSRRRIMDFNDFYDRAKGGRGQRGFSSLEILIATILIALLIAGGVYYANIGEKVDAVNMASIQTAAVVRFPEAIMTIYAQTNDLTRVTKADLVATNSVINNKPIDWAIMRGGGRPTKNEISIKFTFPRASQATGFLHYLNSHKDTTMIKSASSADQGKATVARYSVSNA